MSLLHDLACWGSNIVAQSRFSRILNPEILAICVTNNTMDCKYEWQYIKFENVDDMFDGNLLRDLALNFESSLLHAIFKISLRIVKNQ